MNWNEQVQTLCYLTDNTYNKEQVLRMERQILRAIDFDLSVVDVTVFMDKILQIESDLAKEVVLLAKIHIHTYLYACTYVCDIYPAHLSIISLPYEIYVEGYCGHPHVIIGVHGQ